MADKSDDMLVVAVICVIHRPELLCLPPSGGVEEGISARWREGPESGHRAASKQTKSFLLMSSSSRRLPSSQAVGFLSVARQQL